MIERYLSIIEVSQKQAYIFGSNELKENIRRSAEISWLTQPERIQDIIGDTDVFDCKANCVYAGGGHTVLAFDSYGKAREFNRRYSFTLRTMNPEIEVFLFTIPYCSGVSARKMLEHVCSGDERSQDSDKMFAEGELEKGAADPDTCSPSAYLKELVRGLEWKKALRRASFRQGSFGVEELDATRRVRAGSMKGSGTAGTGAGAEMSGKALKNLKISFLDRSAYDGAACSPQEQLEQAVRYEKLRERYGKVAGSNPIPEGFAEATRFGDLGGTQGDINLLAVVHIDGNGMSMHCNRFYEGLSRAYRNDTRKDEAEKWEDFRNAVNKFSTGIDSAFKKALEAMYARVGRSIKEGNLEKLSLKKEVGTGKQYFPIRGIIASGDDICFVTDGRIGIECAAAFLEELAKSTDEPFTASAGVTIIHQKYPFFRAYELAESLCRNAKEFAADLRMKQREAYRKAHPAAKEFPAELTDNGTGICAIDWHLEMGEIGLTLDEVRREYLVKERANGKPAHLEMRPYVVKVQSDTAAPADVRTIEPHRQYEAFRKQMKLYLNTTGTGAGEDLHARLKELRGILKEGRTEAEHYIRFHKLKGMAVDNYFGIFKEIQIRENTEDIPLYVETADGEERSVLFDAAEAIEIYTPMY